jgi:hypothetical protein
MSVDARFDIVRVRCGDCGGTGQRKLTRQEREVLHRIAESTIGDQWTPTGAIAIGLPGVKRTALIGRLINLYALGLLDRRRGERARGEHEWRIK